MAAGRGPKSGHFPEAQKEALNQLAVKNFLFPESMLDETASEPVEIDENTPQITLIQSLISTLKRQIETKTV